MKKYLTVGDKEKPEKKNISPKEEANALIVDVSGLTLRLVGDFVNYSGGCFKVSKESSHFIVTVKLERKKEVKKGNESKTR